MGDNECALSSVHVLKGVSWLHVLLYAVEGPLERARELPIKDWAIAVSPHAVDLAEEIRLCRGKIEASASSLSIQSTSVLFPVARHLVEAEKRSNPYNAL